MPFYSKMMGSYPFQLIRGLGHSTMGRNMMIGAGAGAAIGATDSRRSRTGGAIRGAMAGALGAGVVSSLSGGGGAAGVFMRNMARPGNAKMYGGALHNTWKKGMITGMSAIRSGIRSF